MEEIIRIIWLCLFVAMVVGGLIGYWLGALGKTPTPATDDIVSLETKLTAAREECESCGKARKTLETRVNDLERSLLSSKSRTAELENKVRTLETPMAVEVIQAAPPDPVGASWASLAAGIERDNLEDIHGIGPKLATLLHGLGVHTFKQIALWSDTDIDRIDEKLAEFKGRIRRENWVESAKECHWRKYSEALAGYAPGTGKVTPTE
jgi:predicted flap endonuclease-1-like 5' DNA nuclease